MFEHDITEYAKDGRLCEPNDGKRYRMRELIDEVKRLGRPLTEKEAIRFERIGANMDKAVVNMYSWVLSGYNDGYIERYSLSGIAEYHPRLGKDAYIYNTPTLQKFSFEEDELTYETEDIIYKCPLKYMHTKPYKNSLNVEELVNRDKVSSSILDKIIAASAKLTLGVDLDNEFMAHILEVTKNGKMEIEAILKADDDRMIKIAKEYDDCIYIEASNIDGGDKLAYHFGNECGIVEPDINIGTYQDSILYRKYRQSEEDVALDFRYFPRGTSGDCIETYSWSDNIKQAVIKNTRDFCIKFNDQEIAPGELKVFTPEGHKQGLISPDCYNGKSILFDLFPEETKKIMDSEEKHCVMDDTEKPIEITEEIEEVLQKGMEIVQKDFPSLFDG